MIALRDIQKAAFLARSSEVKATSVDDIGGVSDPLDKSGSRQGRVTLVGAGPGDPDLLTLKAWRVIQAADVIVYDNLVSQSIRELFPCGIETIYVGKAKDNHSASQSEINQILVALARQGKRVCRLKGGDAFVFGRGGEEVFALASAGIAFEVVPGITAASGCTTYAKMPLTHRGITQGCTFITAHAGRELEHNWQALAKLNQTLVIYMGLSRCELICQQLTQNGLDRETPAAIIEKGCTEEQSVYTATLGELAALRDTHQIGSPALIVIGHTVTFASQIDALVAQHNPAVSVIEPSDQHHNQQVSMALSA